MNAHGHHEREPSPARGRTSEKTSIISSNLAKLKDMYGDVSEQKGGGGGGDSSKERINRRDSSGEEVIRLGGSWR